MNALRDTLLDTANEYISQFNDPGPELRGVIARRSADCQHHILPLNLGLPPRTNDEYLKYSKRIRSIVGNFRLQISGSNAPLVDEVARKVVLSLMSTGDTDFGPYANEYMIVLEMSEDGHNIYSITEFLDSQYTMKFLQFVGIAALTNASEV